MILPSTILLKNLVFICCQSPTEQVGRLKLSLIPEQNPLLTHRALRQKGRWLQLPMTDKSRNTNLHPLANSLMFVNSEEIQAPVLDPLEMGYQLQATTPPNLRKEEPALPSFPFSQETVSVATANVSFDTFSLI